MHSYTLELSFFCAAQGNVRGEAYTPQSYTDMGVDLGMPPSARRWPQAVISSLASFPCAEGACCGCLRRERRSPRPPYSALGDV